jgi:hypothetical protein
MRLNGLKGESKPVSALFDQQSKSFHGQHFRGAVCSPHVVSDPSLFLDHDGSFLGGL